MAKSLTELQLKVTADARGAAAGLRPLESSLQQVSADAESADKSLDSLSQGTHTIRVNDSEVQAAEDEISRLRTQMREDLRADVHADTRDAQRKIKGLQSNIRALKQEKPDIKAKVSVDATGLQRLTGIISQVRGSVEGGGGGGGGGGLVGGLTAARGGMALMGGEAAAAAGPIGILAGGLIIASKAAWELGEAAAEVETQVAQLDALTQGMGEETFGELQKWAAATPFAIDDATDATKKLVAAGVPLQQIPDWLNDIGNVAAATGVPIEQVGTVFGQMVSKGKASYEELQQLAEAGIPVWQTLADKLGLSVAEVQKLATEGKLGADAISLVREELNNLYPDAMSRQGKTFNGLLSTTKDTLAQTGQALGVLFLPAMKDTLELFLDILNPTLKAAQALGTLNDKIEAFSGSSLVGVLSPGVAILDALNGGMNDTADAADAATTNTDALTDSVLQGMNASDDAAAAAERQTDALQQLADRADDTAARYEDLKDSFTTVNSFMVDGLGAIYDYEGAIDNLAESLKDGAQFAPDTEQGRTNWGNLVDLAESASARVQSVLETDGAKAAGALFESQRKAMARLLVDSGVKSQEAWQLVNQVLIKPHEMRIELAQQDQAKLEAQVARLREKKATIEAKLQIPPLSPAAAEVQEGLKKRLKPIDAKIHAKTEKLDKVHKELSGAAKTRNAKIKPVVDPESLHTSRTTLNALTATETKIIKVHMQENPTGQTLDPASVGQMLGANNALRINVAPAGTGGAQMGAQSAPVTHLAPRQTPVKVYIDGRAVADQIEMSSRRLYTQTSVRRSA
jgi:tape measure domain-containing protein